MRDVGSTPAEGPQRARTCRFSLVRRDHHHATGFLVTGDVPGRVIPRAAGRRPCRRRRGDLVVSEVAFGLQQRMVEGQRWDAIRGTLLVREGDRFSPILWRVGLQPTDLGEGEKIDEVGFRIVDLEHGEDDEEPPEG